MVRSKSFWLVSFGLIVLAPVAQAQRVDFEKETHFRCYTISNQTPNPSKTVTLDDEFLPPVEVVVDEPKKFCPPTSEDGLPITAPEEYLTMYDVSLPLEPDLEVSTMDQFGARTLTAIGVRELLVPTQKPTEKPKDVPSLVSVSLPGGGLYLCYEVTGDRVGTTVTLQDQFSTDTVRVERPKLFCNPVEKVSAEGKFRILEREVHLTCYEIFGPQRTEATTFGVVNQFETDQFTVTSFDLLCVPSETLGFKQL